MAPPIFPSYHVLPSFQLPWEVLLVQKPFSLSSLVHVWLSTLKILAPHASSMRLSEQYVTVCLWDSVYCNAFFLMSADISSFECLFFLNVVSICCPLICTLSSALQSAAMIHCLHCPAPLLECGLAELCMADVLCVLALIRMQQAYNCLEAETNPPFKKK